MKTRHSLVFALLLLSYSVHAQKKVKEYYDNGNLKFEGKYTYTWQQDEFFEILMQEAPKQNLSMRSKDEIDEISQYLNLIPTKAYDGLCRFYYPDGKKLFEGTFVHGTPDGKFTYWHTNGATSGALNFVNGMADGIWQVWDDKGNLLSSYSYKAIPQDTLAVLYKDFFFDNMRRSNDEATGKDRISEYLNRKRALETIGNEIRMKYNMELKPFREVMDKRLYKTSIWDGKFIVNEEGAPYLEFYYSNNKPSGTWKMWKRGQLYFECSFKDGKAIDAKKHEIEGDDELYTNNPVEMIPPVAVEAVDPNGISEIAAEAPVAEENKIFTYVEQMPEFPGGQSALTDFVAKNIVYPKKAKEKGIEGKAIVQLIINADGSVDASGIQVWRSLGYDTDEEIIRMVKKMPKWKPGKQNGVAVRTRFTIPVTFKMQ